MTASESISTLLSLTRSYINAHIKEIEDVDLPLTLQSLSLHCNALTSVTGLGHMHCLRHLDLSSNLITSMDGLNNLFNLQVLNLACNKIQLVSGLAGLRFALHKSLSIYTHSLYIKNI